MTPAYTRRFILAVPAALLTVGTAAAQSADAASPVEIVTEIYRRAVRDKDSNGVTFPLDPKDRRRAFSKAIVRRWAAAEARTPKGDQGPLEFDPVTNSQDSSSLRGFRVASRDTGEAAQRVDVTLTETSRRKVRSDLVVHYDFVLEDGRWKIDDISSTSDGERWSLRQILAASQ